MAEGDQLDPEYNWIVRTCTNAFNVYLTVLHFIFYDNTINMEPEDAITGGLSYTLFLVAVDLLVYFILQ